jgi:hypothetical protein
MTASFGDVVSWFLPLLIGGVVTLCGLLAVLLGRFDSGSGWEVRGTVAWCLGVLALPALPFVVLNNPSLSQRTAWTAETEEAKQRSRERQERLKGIAERHKEIADKLAELDKAPARPIGSPLATVWQSSREERQKARAQRDKEMARTLAERQELQKLQRESLALSSEKLALTVEEGRDYDRLGSIGRGRPRDPMLYLLPLAWGAALYGLGWLLGRKKSAAEETKVAPPAPALPP